jgi:hypothetical protein
LTHEEHRLKHVQLHDNLDELIADWVAQTPAMPSSSTVIELMLWSKQQTRNPTPNPFLSREEAHAEVKRG